VPAATSVSTASKSSAAHSFIDDRATVRPELRASRAVFNVGSGSLCMVNVMVSARARAVKPNCLGSLASSVSRLHNQLGRPPLANQPVVLYTPD
jgi:hypothetical protein